MKVYNSIVQAKKYTILIGGKREWRRGRGVSEGKTEAARDRGHLTIETPVGLYGIFYVFCASQ